MVRGNKRRSTKLRLDQALNEMTALRRRNDVLAKECGRLHAALQNGGQGDNLEGLMRAASRYTDALRRDGVELHWRVEFGPAPKLYTDLGPGPWLTSARGVPVALKGKR